MRKWKWALILYGFLALPLYAQKLPALGGYRLRATFFPVGLTYISGFKGSDNMFTDFYLKTATTGGGNTTGLELLYETKKSFIIFGRYESVMLPWAHDFYEYKEYEFLENEYAKYQRSNGNTMLNARVNGADRVPNGFSIGAGYSFKIKRFSIEPYFAIRALRWKSYNIYMIYKSMEENHYYKEEYVAKGFLALAPMAGIKFIWRIKGRFGLTMEPSYALMPVKISYDYTLQDSEGFTKRAKVEEKSLLSIFQVNLGIYFAMIKR